jgi:hypothetical protein
VHLGRWEVLREQSAGAAAVSRERIWARRQPSNSPPQSFGAASGRRSPSDPPQLRHRPSDPNAPRRSLSEPFGAFRSLSEPLGVLWWRHEGVKQSPSMNPSRLTDGCPLRQSPPPLLTPSSRCPRERSPAGAMRDGELPSDRACPERRPEHPTGMRLGRGFDEHVASHGEERRGGEWSGVERSGEARRGVT